MWTRPEGNPDKRGESERIVLEDELETSRRRAKVGGCADERAVASEMETIKWRVELWGSS